jgi:hypothetical protein
MADPLSLLREFTRNKKPVSQDNDYFIFDGIRYPKNIETTFRSQRGKNAPYTLEAIYFYLQNSEKKYTDYLADCRKYNLPHVSLVDRK